MSRRLRTAPSAALPNSADTHILHFTEAYGGGVATAIKQYIDTTPSVSASLLARVRAEHVTPDDVFKDAMTVRSLWALLKEWRRVRHHAIDIVHAHSSLAGVIARLWKHPTAKTVYSPHGVAFIGRKGRLGRAIAFAIERLLAARTDAVGAVGSYEAEQMIAVGASDSRVTVVPHALAVSEARSGRANEPAHLVVVGRISYQKFPEFVADVIERAQGTTELSGATWTWVGDGDPVYRHRLEALGAHVTGWKARSEVLQELASATAMLHAARYEGFPMTVLESLSVGTPVVALDIPALRDASSIIRVSSSHEAVSSLGRLLDHEEWLERSRMGQMEVSRRFSTEAQAVALRRLYGLAVT